MMRHKKNRRILRFLSALTAGIFCLQSFGFAEVAPASDLRLPKDIGLVKDSYESPHPQSAHSETIINIKDIHDNWSAQESITHILENLVSNYGIRTIGIEGMEGAIDTSFLGAFPDREIRENTASSMMKQGKLSAGEFLSLISEGKISVYGMEDNSLYEENLKAYKKILKSKKENFEKIDAIGAVLNQLEQKIYSEELSTLNENGIFSDNGRLKFSAKWKVVSAFAEKYGVPVSDYANLAKLVDCFAREKEINFTKLEEEREVFLSGLAKKLDKEELQYLLLESISYKLGRISKGSFISYLLDTASKHEMRVSVYPNVVSYSDYMLLYESIDMDSLKSEAAELEERIRGHLFRNEEEKTLYHFEKQFEILKDLFDAKLRSDSLRFFKAHESEFDSAPFAAFLKEKASKYGLGQDVSAELTEIFRRIPEAMQFYNLAEQRNEAILKNTVQKMRENGDHMACLVTGGFHSQGITEILKNNQSSYIVILPRFSKSAKRPYLTIIENSSDSYREFAASEMVQEAKMEATADLLAQAAYKVVQKSPRQSKEILNQKIKKEIESVKEVYLKNYKAAPHAPIVPAPDFDSAPKPVVKPAQLAGSKDYIAPRVVLQGAPVLAGVNVYLYRVTVQSNGAVIADFRVDFSNEKFIIPITVQMEEGKLTPTKGEAIREGEGYESKKAKLAESQEIAIQGDLKQLEGQSEATDQLLQEFKSAQGSNPTLTAESFGHRRGLTPTQIDALNQLIEAQPATVEAQKAAGDLEATPVQAMSREEYAEYLVDHLLTEAETHDEIYELLIVKPEFRDGKNVEKKLKDIYGSEFFIRQVRAWADQFKTFWTQIANGKVIHRLVTAVGRSDTWKNFRIGQGTKGETAERHKGYVTFKNIVKGATVERFESFLIRLANADFNGQVKITIDKHRALRQFDNIVIHGRTKADVDLALKLAQEIFASEGLSMSRGIDRDGYTSTELLVRKVLEKRAEKEKAEAVEHKESPAEVAPASPADTEARKAAAAGTATAAPTRGALGEAAPGSSVPFPIVSPKPPSTPNPGETAPSTGFESPKPAPGFTPARKDQLTSAERLKIISLIDEFNQHAKAGDRAKTNETLIKIFDILENPDGTLKESGQLDFDNRLVTERAQMASRVPSAEERQTAKQLAKDPRALAKMRSAIASSARPLRVTITDSSGRSIRVSYKAAGEAVFEIDKQTAKTLINEGAKEDLYEILTHNSTEGRLKEGTVVVKNKRLLLEAIDQALMEEDQQQAESLVKQYSSTPEQAAKLAEELDSKKESIISLLDPDAKSDVKIHRQALIEAYSKVQKLQRSIEAAKEEMESLKKEIGQLRKTQKSGLVEPHKVVEKELKLAKTRYDIQEMRHELGWISKEALKEAEGQFNREVAGIKKRYSPAVVQAHYEKLELEIQVRIRTIKKVQSAIRNAIEKNGLDKFIESYWLEVKRDIQRSERNNAAHARQILRDKKVEELLKNNFNTTKEKATQKQIRSAHLEANKNFQEQFSQINREMAKEIQMKTNAEAQAKSAENFKKDAEQEMFKLAAKGYVAKEEIEKILQDSYKDKYKKDNFEVIVRALTDISAFNRLGLNQGVSEGILKKYLLNSDPSSLRIWVSELTIMQIQLNLLIQEFHEEKAVSGKIDNELRQQIADLRSQLSRGVGFSVSLDSLKASQKNTLEAKKNYLKTHLKAASPNMAKLMRVPFTSRLLNRMASRLSRIAPASVLVAQLIAGLPVDATIIDSYFHAYQTQEAQARFREQQKTALFEAMESIVEQADVTGERLKELDAATAELQGFGIMQAVEEVFEGGEPLQDNRKMLSWAVRVGLVRIEDGASIYKKLNDEKTSQEDIDAILKKAELSLQEIRGLLERLKDVRVGGKTLYENWKNSEKGKAWKTTHAEEAAFLKANMTSKAGTKKAKEEVEKLRKERFNDAIDPRTGKMDASKLPQYIAFVKEAVKYIAGYENESTGELSGLKADQLIMLDLFLLNKSVGLLAGGGKTIVYPLYHVIARAALGNDYHGMIVAESMDGAKNFTSLNTVLRTDSRAETTLNDVVEAFGMRMVNGSTLHEENDTNGLTEALKDADTIVVIGKTERAHIQNLSEDHRDLRNAINKNIVTLIDEVHLLATEREAALLSKGAGQEVELDQIENVKTIIDAIWDYEKNTFKPGIILDRPFKTEQAYKDKVEKFKNDDGGQQRIFKYDEQVYITKSLQDFILDKTGTSNTKIVSSVLQALTNLKKDGAAGGWKLTTDKEGKEVIAPISEFGEVKESSIISDIYYQAALALYKKKWDAEAAQKVVKQSDTSTQVATIDALHSDYGARLLGASGTTQDLEDTIEAILASPVININPSKNQFSTFRVVGTEDGMKDQAEKSARGESLHNGRLDLKRRSSLIFVYNHELVDQWKKYFEQKGYKVRLIGAGEENPEDIVREAGLLDKREDEGLIFTDHFFAEYASKIDYLKQKRINAEKLSEEEQRFMEMIDLLENKNGEKDTTITGVSDAVMASLRKFHYFGYGQIIISTERGRVGRSYQDRDGVGLDLFELGIGDEKSTELMFNQTTRRNLRNITDGNRYVLVDEAQMKNIDAHLNDIVKSENSQLRKEVLRKLEGLHNELAKSSSLSVEEKDFLSAYVKLKYGFKLGEFTENERIMLFQKYMTIKRVNEGTRFIVQDTTRTRWVVDPIKKLLRDIRRGENLSDEQRALLSNKEFREEAIAILQENLESALRQDSDDAQLLLSSTDRESGRAYTLGISLSALNDAEHTFKSLKNHGQKMNQLVQASQRLDDIQTARDAIYTDGWEKSEFMRSYAEAKRQAGSDYLKLIEYTYQVSLHLADKNMVSKIGRSNYKDRTIKLSEDTSGQLELRKATDSTSPLPSTTIKGVGVQSFSQHTVLNLKVDTEASSTFRMGQSVGKAMLIGNKLYIITFSGEDKEGKVVSVLTHPEHIKAVQKLMENDQDGNAAFFDVDVNLGNASTENEGGLNLTLMHLPAKITPNTTFADLLQMTGMGPLELMGIIRETGVTAPDEAIFTTSIQDMAIQADVSVDELVGRITHAAKAYQAYQMVGMFYKDPKESWETKIEAFLKDTDTDERAPAPQDTARLRAGIQKMRRYERASRDFVSVREAALKTLDADLSPQQVAAFNQHFLMIYPRILGALTKKYMEENPESVMERLDEIVKREVEREIERQLGQLAEVPEQLRAMFEQNIRPQVKQQATGIAKELVLEQSPEDLKIAVADFIKKDQFVEIVTESLKQSDNAENRFLGETLDELRQNPGSAALAAKFRTHYPDDEDKILEGWRKFLTLALTYQVGVPALIRTSLDLAQNTHDDLDRERLYFDALRMAKNNLDDPAVQPLLAEVEDDFAGFLKQKADEAATSGRFFDLENLIRVLEGFKNSPVDPGFLSDLQKKLAAVENFLTPEQKEAVQELKIAAGVTTATDEERFEKAMKIAEGLEDGPSDWQVLQGNGLALLFRQAQIYLASKKVFEKGSDRLEKTARKIGSRDFLLQDGLRRIYFYPDEDPVETLFSVVLSEWANDARFQGNTAYKDLMLIETAKTAPVLQVEDGKSLNLPGILAQLLGSRYLDTEEKRNHEGGLTLKSLAGFMDEWNKTRKEKNLARLNVRASMPGGKIYIHTDRHTRDEKIINLDDETMGEDSNTKNLGFLAMERVQRIDTSQEDHDPNSSVNNGDRTITDIEGKHGSWFEREMKGILNQEKAKLVTAIMEDLELLRKDPKTLQTKLIRITKSGGIRYKNLKQAKKEYPDSYQGLQRIAYDARVPDYRDADPRHRQQLYDNLETTLNKEMKEIRMKQMLFTKSMHSEESLNSYVEGEAPTLKQFELFLDAWLHDLDQHEIQHEIDTRLGRRAYWNSTAKTGDERIHKNEILSHLRSIARGRVPHSIIVQVTTLVSRKESGIGYLNAGIDVLQRLYKHLDKSEQKKLNLPSKKGFQDPATVSAFGESFSQIPADKLREAAVKAIAEYSQENVPPRFQELKDFTEQVMENNKAPENLAERSVLKDPVVGAEIEQTKSAIEKIYQAELEKAESSGYKNAVDYVQKRGLHFKTWEYAVKVVLQGYDLEKIRKHIQGELHTLSVMLKESTDKGDHLMGLKEAEEHLPAGYEQIEREINEQNAKIRQSTAPILEELGVPSELNSTELNDKTRAFVTPAALRNVPFYVEGEPVERGSTAAYSFDSFSFVIVATEDDPQRAESYKYKHILGHEAQHFRIDIVNEKIREGIVEALSLLNAKRSSEQNYQDVLRHLALTEDKAYIDFLDFALQYLNNFSYEEILLAQATGDLTLLGFYSLEAALLQLQKSEGITDETPVKSNIPTFQNEEEKPFTFRELKEHAATHGTAYRKIVFIVDPKNHTLTAVYNKNSTKDSSFIKSLDRKLYEQKSSEHQKKSEAKKKEASAGKADLTPTWAAKVSLTAGETTVEIDTTSHLDPSLQKRMGSLYFEGVSDSGVQAGLKTFFQLSAEEISDLENGKKAFYVVRSKDSQQGIAAVAFMDNSYNIGTLRYFPLNGKEGFMQHELEKIKEGWEGSLKNLELTFLGEARIVIGGINARVHEEMAALMRLREAQGNDLDSSELHDFYVGRIRSHVRAHNTVHGTNYEVGFPAMGFNTGADGVNPYAGNISNWNTPNAIHGGFHGKLVKGVYHLDFDAAIRRPGPNPLWVTSDRASLVAVGEVSQEEKNLIWLAQEFLDLQAEVFEKTGSLREAERAVQARIKQRGLTDATGLFSNHRIDAARELYDSLHSPGYDEILEDGDDSKAVTFEKFVWNQGPAKHGRENIFYTVNPSDEQDASQVRRLDDAESQILSEKLQKKQIQANNGVLIDTVTKARIFAANGLPVLYFKSVTVIDRENSGKARVSSIEDTFLRVKGKDGNFHAVRTGTIPYTIGEIENIKQASPQSGARLAEALDYQKTLDLLGGEDVGFEWTASVPVGGDKYETSFNYEGRGLSTNHGFKALTSLAGKISQNGFQTVIQSFLLPRLDNPIRRLDGSQYAKNVVAISITIGQKDYSGRDIPAYYNLLVPQADYERMKTVISQSPEVLFNAVMRQFENISSHAVPDAKARDKQNLAKQALQKLEDDFDKDPHKWNEPIRAGVDASNKAVIGRTAVLLTPVRPGQEPKNNDFTARAAAMEIFLNETSGARLVASLPAGRDGQARLAAAKPIIFSGGDDEKKILARLGGLSLPALADFLTVLSENETWRPVDWDAELEKEIKLSIAQAQNPAEARARIGRYAATASNAVYDEVFSQWLVDLSDHPISEPQAIILDLNAARTLLQNKVSWQAYKTKFNQLKKKLPVFLEVVGDASTITTEEQSEILEIGHLSQTKEEALSRLTDLDIQASNISVGLKFDDRESAKMVEMVDTFYRQTGRQAHFVLVDEMAFDKPTGLLLSFFVRDYQFVALGFGHERLASIQSDLSKALGLDIFIHAILPGEIGRLIRAFLQANRFIQISA